MIQTICRVESVELVGSNTYVLKVHSPEISSTIKPGQFVNIKVHDLYQPFLRRPFSVYRTDDESFEIIFNVVGYGTKILSVKQKDDKLDVIGPLGCPFTAKGEYDTALLVGGGLGVAPLPILSATVKKTQKKIETFLGARNRDQLVTQHLTNVHLATDDGSIGFEGTVIQLLENYLKKSEYSKPKIFGCGPNAMLKNLSDLAKRYKIPCEVSLESAMACGIGLCQGCPVETVNGEKKYTLVCTGGPVFDAQTINIA